MSKTMRAQGVYYLVGGLWPLIDFPSFERVTGPKPDRFVTEVASALYAAIGSALLVSCRRPPAQIRGLALLAAAASAAMDLRHRPDVRPVYVGDAAFEAVLIAAALREWIRTAPQEAA